jgi:hypothetical protein
MVVLFDDKNDSNDSTYAPRHDTRKVDIPTPHFYICSLRFLVVLLVSLFLCTRPGTPVAPVPFKAHCSPEPLAASRSELIIGREYKLHEVTYMKRLHCGGVGGTRYFMELLF